MKRMVAFDYDSLMGMGVDEAYRVLEELRENDVEVFVVSWRVGALSGYKAMVESLSRNGLIGMVDSLARFVPDGAVYVARRCVSTTLPEARLVEGISQMLNREEEAWKE